VRSIVRAFVRSFVGSFVVRSFQSSFDRLLGAVRLLPLIAVACRALVVIRRSLVVVAAFLVLLVLTVDAVNLLHQH